MSKNDPLKSVVLSPKSTLELPGEFKNNNTTISACIPSKY